jgi:hypothetical protein
MYSQPMMASTFSELIGTWPRGVDDGGRELTSIATFAADLGVAYYHAQTMRYRNSISVEFWPAVIAAARKRGRVYTHEDLASMRERRRRPKRSPATQAVAG